MKCQYCEKPATFHITDLIGEGGPQVKHLCEDHARKFLQDGSSKSAASAVTGALAKTLSLGKAKEELAKLDQKECPVCGITFFEFRNTGRLGCPHDYTHFESDLTPLLVNIHDSTEHVGKRPARAAALADSEQDLIALRREMAEAVSEEKYERAGEIRDQLQELENSLADRASVGDDDRSGTDDRPADVAGDTDDSKDSADAEEEKA